MDTTVVQRLPYALFDLLQWYDLLAAPEPNWDGEYKTRWMQLGPEGELQYNTGVMLFRAGKCTTSLFTLWHHLWQSEANCDVRTPWDQCAFYRAIRRTPFLKIGTLSTAFNCRYEREAPPWLYIIHSDTGRCFGT
eukprot:TRINITY_DN17989_c0_g1_i2.p1 TRINITY_DN17989_c0_g1~~TRINITY_DN17989_c0_g1_i2.p1  ORF type:complete len:135 (+),score=10.59 TRINITY_DN17989_c0_g1_i2:424-828(+)